MSYISKIHLWVGSTSISPQKFEKYFDQSHASPIDPATGLNREQIVPSNFAKDLGIPYMFDEDFLYVFTSEQSNLEELLEGIVSNSDDDILEPCISKGINKANLAIGYSDASLDVCHDKMIFNHELKYIGCFDWM